jgi:SAM-dependent methyltransferase
VSDNSYQEYLVSHPGLNPEASEGDYLAMVRGYAVVYDGVLPTVKDVPMLEVGCGQGFFLYYLKSRGFTNAAGIDLSPQQAEFGRKFGLDIRCEDATTFLPQPGRYAWISMLDVLEHVPKAKVVALLTSVFDSLQPGGTCLVQVPNMENPFNVHIRYSDFTHEGGYTSGSLTQALRLAGFRSVDVRPWGPPRPARLSKRVIRWMVAQFLGRLYEIPHEPMGAHRVILHSRRIYALATRD